MNTKEHYPLLNVGGTIYSPIDIEELTELINLAVRNAFDESNSTTKNKPKSFMDIPLIVYH